MPITEIVRVLARAPGVCEGSSAEVELIYDVDGRLGDDEGAIGFPAFFLRVLRDGVLLALRGPFQHEDEAVAAALEWRAGL